MSRKWNLFRKKVSKADSHGTTAADEELQFQAIPPHANVKVTKLSAVQSQIHDSVDFDSQKSSDVNLQQQKGGPFRDNGERDLKNDNNNESGVKDKIHNLFLASEDLRDKDPNELAVADEVMSLSMGHKNNVPSGPLSSASQKTLTKPGIQKNFSPQAKDVSISDEYSDPFDALRRKRMDKQNTITDGYIEPYKAQQIFHNTARTAGEDGKNSAQTEYNVAMGRESDIDHYQDPWDKQTGYPTLEPEYGLNHTRGDTIPYSTARRNGVMNPDDKRNVLHNSGYSENTNSHLPRTNMGNSWSSGEFPTSADSPNMRKYRLVRVEQPRVSPRSSPHFDRRLILPVDSGNYSDNYSEPWSKQVKFRPVDKRLIKAEPSLEELRRMSPSGVNSVGTGSPISSGRGSPVENISNSHSGIEMSLHSDATRRCSSPVITNSAHTGLPSNLLLMNKSKSRSLDMRNHPQILAAMIGHGRKTSHNRFPKSASDEQLVVHNSISTGHISQQLHGNSDYEEPWDKSLGSQTLITEHNKKDVLHMRSRSYELSKQSLQTNEYLQNKSSSSTDGSCSFYEQPWDKVNPSNHLQSIQRFQQRRLELHPSEAINTRDFDPLLPLENQIWYHAGITRDDAEMRLMSKCEGSYLVRKSESTKNSYSLSVQTTKNCIHMLLRCTRDGSWILGEFSAPFLSAPEMIAHYARNKLKINDSDYVLLSYPVPDPFL